MPITLDVSQEDIDTLSLAPGAKVALRDPRDEAALAILTSESRMALIRDTAHVSLRHLQAQQVPRGRAGPRCRRYRPPGRFLPPQPDQRVLRWW